MMMHVEHITLIVKLNLKLHCQIQFCMFIVIYTSCNGTITITGAGADDNTRQGDEREKLVVFKICAPFTDCISEINNTQIDYSKDIDFVLPMYSLIEYGNNYLKTSRSLW